MKKLFSLATALLILLPLSANAIEIPNVQIKEVWAGGYFASNNPTKAYTRMALSRNLTDAETSCQFKNIVVISSGTVVTDPSVEPSAISLIATDHYQQMFSTALAANVNSSNVAVNVTTGCTPDGKFAIINRISIEQ